MDASQSVLLVRAVVVVAIASYLVLLVVLSGRRWSTTWALMLAWISLELTRSGAWFLLTLERRAIYEHIPPNLWVILVVQTIESAVLWAIALRALARDRDARAAAAQGP